MIVTEYGNNNYWDKIQTPAILKDPKTKALKEGWQERPFFKQMIKKQEKFTKPNILKEKHWKKPIKEWKIIPDKSLNFGYLHKWLMNNT